MSKEKSKNGDIDAASTPNVVEMNDTRSRDTGKDHKQNEAITVDKDRRTNDDSDAEDDVEKGDDEKSGEEEDRGGWDSKADFILAVIGYAVGLGNIWRFPYLCYKNGGGVFLIPYTICLVLLGIPMFYLEIGFGQYLQVGGLSVWEVVPVFKGVGYGSATIASMLNIYYIVIIAWILVYLVASFSPTLPWSICDGWWNDIYCYDSKSMNTTNNGTQFLTGEYGNTTIAMADAEYPAEQFWDNFVLQISEGIHDFGGIVWYLALALVVAWLLTYLCIVKGVKTTGKIVWFTTTFPYLVMTILLIRCVTLPGAGDGIYFYLVPDWSKLFEAQAWVDAGSQIFFSLGIGFAGLISLGSYNPYNNNILIDTLVVCLVNCLTSFYAGFMVFGALGFMAWEQGKDVHDVVNDGPGLTFISVPTAIAEMPGANFWAILFFIMLLLLGLDSQFCVVEGFYTCLSDEYPRIFRKHRAKILALLCVIYYCLALPCISRAGMYFFTLMDGWGASGYVLLWAAMWECIAICYGWGVKSYMRGISDMLGHVPCYGWPACWMVITPLFLIFIQLFSFISYDGAHYEEYRFPIWAECLGWLMSAFSMHWVFTYSIYAMIVAPGSYKERLDTGLSPRPYLVLRGQDDDELIGKETEPVISTESHAGTFKTVGDDFRPSYDNEAYEQTSRF
ncbi:sodium- and chloride-dependent GABA transporter 1-like [Glandiceps talaboti]